MFNPVAKHAHKSNRAKVIPNKKGGPYSRKKKHKKNNNEETSQRYT